jgi:uncharacterized protein involved in exopolysaccharide biosynthesis
MAEPSANLTLLDAIGWLLRHWLIIGACALGGAVIAVVCAMLMHPIYRAEIVLVPVKADGLSASLGSVTSQLGGLMSLAGVTLPGAQDRNEAIATLRSREIALRLIREQSMLQKLFASRWDAEANRWRRSAPTDGDALDRFARRILSVRDDTKTGLVTVGIEWRDRKEAAQWANRIVALANQVSQARAITEADRTLEYLDREAKKADSVEVREAVFRLIEAQLKNKAVAVVRPDYAFRVIDQALVPDARRYVWPRKDIFGVAGLMFGGLCGIAVAWLRQSRRTLAAVRAGT